MSYENTLASIAESNPNVVVMTAENRAAIRGLEAKLGERFIDVGIAEMTLVGAAAGLALRGRVPVIHALATFLTLRAFEFIRTDVGIPRLPVKLVGGVPGFLSDANGPTHQAIEDIALMRGIPNMQVWCPSDVDELVAGLPAVIASPEPCYIRYNARDAVVRHTEPFALGRAEVLARGRDATIVTYGFMLGEVWQAREALRARGFDVGVLNVRMLAPFDSDTLMEVARATKMLVTVEDHFAVGGLHSIVAETFIKRHELPCRVLPIALEGKWFKPGLLADVLEAEQMNAQHLARRIESKLR